MEKINNQNIFNLFIHCNGCRLSYPGQILTREEIEKNYVNWDFAITAISLEDAVDIYRDIRGRLRSISHGTRDDMMSIVNDTSHSNEKKNQLEQLMTYFSVTLSVYNTSLENLTFLVSEEDFVKEFHEELRKYESCHITDDLHWPLFIKSGPLPSIHPSSIQMSRNTQESNYNLVENKVYDKGCDACTYKNRFYYLSIVTVLLLIILAFHFIFS